jgi:alkanesulfonate monooxygenase SsuD/methylene tetrahydromethanopterin reductase-like flavin-dependent oxidoreductase (luciferase family)
VSDRRLRFGLAYDALDGSESLAARLPAMLRLVRRAEELGFDSVWLGETHRRLPGYGHSPAPLVLASAIAAATTRIGIGTGVLLLPAYTPLQVAEQAAMVDQLSGGRLILGVASGLEVYRDFGFANFPFGPRDLGPMMDEALRALRELWSSEDVTLDGRYWSYRHAACQPRPLQVPHPPILVGGISERALTRAAESEGWIGGTPYPFELIVKVGERLRTLAGDRRKRTLALIRPIVVSPSGEEARRIADQFVTPLVDYYLKRGAYVRPDFTFARDADGETRSEALREVPIVGDPAECAELIQRYAEQAGVDLFIFRVRFPGAPTEYVEEALDLIANGVLPRIPAGVLG